MRRWARSCFVATFALLVWLCAASPAAAAGPTISVGGNLNGSASPGDVVEVDARLVDPLGASYVVTFRFVNFGWGGWDWEVVSSDPGVLSADPLGTGTLIFDVDGTVVAFPGSPEGLFEVELSNGTKFTGADAISVEMDGLTDHAAPMTAYQVDAPSAATPTPTATRTRTPTRTPTAVRTAMPTRTLSPTRTASNTRTVTQTRTPTPTRTVSRTPTQTRTPAPTRTETPSRTPTPVRLIRDVTLSGNLNMNSEETTVVEQGVQFLDSLGVPHDLTFRFQKLNFNNGWDWEISTGDPTILGPSPLASGTIGFDESGRPALRRGEPEARLQLTFTNGARPMVDADAVHVELDGLTGHDAPHSLRSNAPVRPTATPTRTPRPMTPTRTPTATRTVPPTRTPAPTRTPTQPVTPSETPIGGRSGAHTVEWVTPPRDVEIVDGNTTVETMTFRVSRRLSGARVAVMARGGSVTVDPIPTELQAGVDYPVTLRMTVARRGQRLVGSVRILDRSKTALGPTGKFMISISKPPPTATRTPVPGISPTRVGGPTRPVSTVEFIPRINWQPAAVQEFMAPGETREIEAAVESTGTLVQPTFHVFGRPGVVEIDPSSLPARLEPGQPHTLRLKLTLPANQTSRSESLTLGVRLRGETIKDQLIIRLTPQV